MKTKIKAMHSSRDSWWLHTSWEGSAQQCTRQHSIFLQPRPVHRQRVLPFGGRKEFHVHIQVGVIIQLIRANIPNMHLPETCHSSHVKKKNKRHRSFSHQNQQKRKITLSATTSSACFLSCYWLFMPSRNQNSSSSITHNQNS